MKEYWTVRINKKRVQKLGKILGICLYVGGCGYLCLPQLEGYVAGFLVISSLIVLHAFQQRVSKAYQRKQKSEVKPPMENI